MIADYCIAQFTPHDYYDALLFAAVTDPKVGPSNPAHKNKATPLSAYDLFYDAGLILLGRMPCSCVCENRAYYDAFDYWAEKFFSRFTPCLLSAHKLVRRNVEI